MHYWSLIWRKIHSLSLTIQNCILEGNYLASFSTPVLVGREAPAWCLSGRRLGLLLLQSGWRCAGLASTALSIGCLAPVRSELLSWLLGWQNIGNLLQSWSSSCWQRQLQGEWDTPDTISIPSLLPPDLLLVWAEIGMPEFPATSSLHRSACCTQVLLLQKLLLPALCESQAVKVVWRAGRELHRNTACNLCWCP